MDMSRKQDWLRLGEALAARRADLGYAGPRNRAAFHRDRLAVHMSYRNLSRLENGERDYYPDETLALVAQVYEVTRQSVDDVLAGQERLAPLPAGAAAALTAHQGGSPPRYANPSEQHIADTPGLDPDDAEMLVRLYRRLVRSGERRTGT